MPKLSKKAREEFSLYIGENGRRQYNALCRDCRRECKQSFRMIIVGCPKYDSKQKIPQKGAILAENIACMEL